MVNLTACTLMKLPDFTRKNSNNEFSTLWPHLNALYWNYWIACENFKHFPNNSKCDHNFSATCYLWNTKKQNKKRETKFWRTNEHWSQTDLSLYLMSEEMDGCLVQFLSRVPVWTDFLKSCLETVSIGFANAELHKINVDFLSLGLSCPTIFPLFNLFIFCLYLHSCLLFNLFLLKLFNFLFSNFFCNWSLEGTWFIWDLNCEKLL